MQSTELFNIIQSKILLYSKFSGKACRNIFFLFQYSLKLLKWNCFPSLSVVYYRCDPSGAMLITIDPHVPIWEAVFRTMCMYPYECVCVWLVFCHGLLTAATPTSAGSLAELSSQDLVGWPSWRRRLNYVPLSSGQQICYLNQVHLTRLAITFDRHGSCKSSRLNYIVTLTKLNFINNI